MGLLNLGQIQTMTGITIRMTKQPTKKTYNQTAMDLIEVALTDKQGNVRR
jgi:hypothetical protein